MRLTILLLILIATLFGSGFWYSVFDTTCDVPVRYHIGMVDERFGTTKEEMKRIAENAVALWEGTLNADLFVYDEGEGSLPINLMFDERQAKADKEAELRADLEAKEGMTESVGAQYEKLIVQFRTLKKEYETRVVAYEMSLKKYNAEVTKWNARGGAPAQVVSDLKKEEVKLIDERAELEVLGESLNKIVNDLNRIGAKGNELITDYNSIVEKYNNEFKEVREFAQGDYTHDAINIYQFNSEEELTIVLTHELGHALSLGHVEGSDSFMYYLMGEQTVAGGIQNPDVAEYTRVCVDENSVTRFLKALSQVFHSFAL